MKQNMTEAEKEARRIRRVLANRESARQTIRRRQALREELVKRVADLSLENENMKVEKDLMMKEYLSLRDRNKELKEQVVKAVKSEVDVGAEIAPRCLETTSPSTELSLVAPGSTEFYDEEGSSKAGELRAIFYVPSCAWFYPLLHQTSESHQPGCQASNKHESLVTNQQRFRQCPNLEGASLQVGSKTDISSTEREGIDHEGKNADINLEEMPTEIDEHEHACGVSLVPSSADRGGQERGFKLDSVSEKSQAASISSYKKHVDPFTAAAARKRRKELTKLKYLHGRQIRLHG
ncbi:uncharacterized protein LOC109824019 [Asparagus officinalis]|uniref:uncharacterized protein LOC109824019 n=1 Tax=Asparagus officinalis TaxID=4686 RepID=UPI00098E6D4F|nr:uncharacterized protein LOC109824019 [Asparagus officinalis]